MTQFNAHPEQKSTNEEICGFTVNFLSKCELFTKITLWNEKGELLCMNSGHPGAALKKIHWKWPKIHQRSWVFFKNSDFLVSISLPSNVIDLWYFKLWISGCKDIEFSWKMWVWSKHSVPWGQVSAH